VLLELGGQCLAIGNWTFAMQRSADRITECTGETVGTGLGMRQGLAVLHAQRLGDGAKLFRHRSKLSLQISDFAGLRVSTFLSRLLLCTIFLSLLDGFGGFMFLAFFLLASSLRGLGFSIGLGRRFSRFLGLFLLGFGHFALVFKCVEPGMQFVATLHQRISPCGHLLSILIHSRVSFEVNASWPLTFVPYAVFADCEMVHKLWDIFNQDR
jgi:hypothetical protein